MNTIDELIDLIDDELSFARNYAERNILLKASKNQAWATRFEKLAKDSLSHASVLQEYLVEQKQNISQVYELPVETQDRIAKITVELVQRTAWIKQMLSM